VHEPLLAIAVGGSGFNKLKNETVMKGIDTVRVPRNRVWMLGVLELAAALGLVVGIVWWSGRPTRPALSSALVE
jgi:hypothetical protein